MRFTSILLGLVAGLVVPRFSEDCNPDDTTNTCYKKSDASEPNMKEQCKDVLGNSKEPSKGHVISSQGCIFGNAPWSDARTGKPLLCGKAKDFKETMIMTGYCSCDSPTLEFAGNFIMQGVLEASKILEKVVCPALQAVDIVMTIGMAAIPPPGKAVTGGMVAAARSAKAYKYAYEAQDAAQGWADFFPGGLNFAGQAGCPSLLKIPSRNDLIKRAFGPLSDAPDELTPGGMDYDQLLCPAKGCKGCKGPKCRNQNTNENNGASKSDKQPAQSTAIKTPESTKDLAKTTGALETNSNPAPTTMPNASQGTQNPAGTTVASGTTSNTSISSSFSSPASSSSSLSETATSTLSCEALAALDTDIESNVNTFHMRSYPIDLSFHRLERRV